MVTHFSRRALFGVSGAVTVGSALALLPGAAVGDPGDMPRLLKNFTDMHAGTPASNSLAPTAPKIQQIVADGDRYFGRLRPQNEWEQYSGVVNDVRLGLANASNGAVASGRLTSTFRVLGSIALATAVPGASRFGDTGRQDAVIAALRWVVESYYAVEGNPYTGEGDVYGDWWDWEIGSPNEITRTLALLHSRIQEVDPGLTSVCVDAMDLHLVYEPRFHSGANRADMTLNYLVQGAMLSDDGRVQEGLAAFLTVMDVIDPADPVDGIRDGFYPDGSFIQHTDVPYTGAYGKNLLVRLTQLVTVMAGTAYSGVAGLAHEACGWVENSFAPIIYEGHVLELVKGRIAARLNVGYEDATILAEALTQLAANLSGEQAAAVKEYVKHMVNTATNEVDVANFASPLAIATFDQLMSDGSVIVRDRFFASGHQPFNSMERSVHGRHGFRFAIARSSSRIAKYEILSGANPRPWFQGEGAYYLFLAGQDQASTYGGEYIHVVHPTQLAGVTAPVGEERTQSGNSPWATNDHSAGVHVDGFGTASQQLGHEFNLTYLNPEGVKSWYMFDDEIVVLAADLTEPDGRQLHTSVDTRISGAGSNPEFHWIDSEAVTGSGPVANEQLRSARWHDPDSGAVVGYLFLDGNEVSLGSGPVSATGPSVTRVVSRVFYEHSGTVPTAVAYAIVPNATESQLLEYQDNRIEILANNETVQGVTHSRLGVTMVNFFAAASVSTLEADGPAGIVVARRQDGTVGIGICEPTFLGTSLVVRLNEPGLQLVSADPEVEVSDSSGHTEIGLDTENACGKVFRVELLDFGQALDALESGLLRAMESGAISALAVPLLDAVGVARSRWQAGLQAGTRAALLRVQRRLGLPRKATAGGADEVDSLRKHLSMMLKTVGRA